MIFSKNPYLALILSVLLFQLTAIYYIVISVRHFLYDKGLLKSYKPEVFTVSVGNITAGGTGKTPTVIRMVNSLTEQNLKTLVITRGYQRKSALRVMIDKTTSVSESGDEPMTIFNKTGQPVVCDKNRLSVIKDIGKEFDIIVLDDAFQHRKLKKDIDIVLIDENRFLGNRLLIPSGILRDTVSRLNFCDIIILSKVKDIYSQSVKEKIDQLKKFEKKILISVLSHEFICNKHEKLKFSDISGRKISLFCGIGNPDDFFSIFKKNEIISTRVFSDHYDYGTGMKYEFDLLIKGSEILITTFKDFVKLSDDQISEYKIYYLDIELEFYNENLKKIELSDLIKDYKLGKQ